jgi:hypothetical protein
VVWHGTEIQISGASYDCRAARQSVILVVLLYKKEKSQSIVIMNGTIFLNRVQAALELYAIFISI